jgi:anti-sigma-K factor RskA
MLDENTLADSGGGESAGGDDLVLRAMLYASGELDAGEAAAFEQRLGEDQAARDALCQAVELSQTFANEPQPAPDPEYRSRVRHRLRQRRRHRVGLRPNQGAFFNHPAFWSVLGAAIAVLLMVILSHFVATTQFEQPDDPNLTRPTQPANGVERVLDAPVTPDMAKTWSDLPAGDRLEKARAEEQRRKLRSVTIRELLRNPD